MDAAAAIKTTDTVHKVAVAGRDGWTVGGMAKGAGMLAPALATMLVVVTTDAVVAPGELDGVLRAATALTFDRIDSDGCQSTNDTVLLLASGASGVAVDPADLTTAVTEVCASLARQLIADAEGAHHDIAIEVVGPRRPRPTRSRSPGRSPATTCSSARSSATTPTGAACSPPWARPKAAFAPHELDVSINDVQVCRAGGVGEDRTLVDLTAREVHVLVDLHAGDQAVTVWTNDLTHDYVHENSAYSS